MATTREKLALLIAEGEEFQYNTFASMSDNGYPEGFKPGWVAWTRRVEQLVEESVTAHSAPVAMINEAKKVRVLGNGPDRFDMARSQYLNALRAVQTMLDNDPFEELLETKSKGRSHALRTNNTDPNPATVVMRNRVVVPKLTRNMRLDKYELIQRLGAGFSAEVWLAQLREEILGVEVDVGADVAMKIYSVGNRGYDSIRVEREFGVASQLLHENLARVYDLVLSPNRPFHTFMVMEYVPGPTLKSFIEEHGPLDPAKVLIIGRQIFSAMIELHSLDAIHRDIKAANMLLPDIKDDSIQVKLVDLGIVSIAAQSQVTAASAFMGSKHSAPLEQLKGEELDERADVYGAGSVLFHCLTGKPMYERAGPEGAIVARMLSKDHEKLAVKTGDPEWLQKLYTFINKCIAVRRDSRPRSAQECLAVVEETERMRQLGR